MTKSNDSVQKISLALISANFIGAISVTVVTGGDTVIKRLNSKQNEDVKRQ